MKTLNPKPWRWVCTALAITLLGLCTARAQVEIPWEDIDKTGSSLADLATRDAGDLTGRVAITDSTPSTNSTTGAITAVGGIATMDNIHAAGHITSGDGFDSASYLERLALRSTRGRAISDGVTPARSVRHEPGDIGAVGGLPITIHGTLPVLPTRPKQLVQILALTGSVTGPDLTAAREPHSLHLLIDPAGSLIIRQVGADPTDQRSLTYANFLAAYSGRQHVRLVVRIASPDSVINPAIWVDGVNVTGSMSSTTSGTAPNWVPPTMVADYYLTGLMWSRGHMPSMAVVLGAWSDAEAIEWTGGGRWPTRFEHAGSAVDPSSSAFVNRGAATGDVTRPTNGFELFSGASAAGFSATHGANGNVSQAVKLGYSFRPGQAWLVEFEWTQGTGALPDFFGAMSSIASNTADLSANRAAEIVAGPNTFVIETTARDATAGFGFTYSRGSAEAGIGVSGFRARPLGAIIRPYHQNGLVLGDMLGRVSGRLVGGSQVPGPGGREITIDVPFSYAGASIQILGGNVLGGLDARVVSIAGYTDTSTTIDVGTTSGGAELVNGHAANGLFDVSTFVTRIISNGGNLYLTATDNPTTGTIQIVLQPLNKP